MDRVRAKSKFKDTKRVVVFSALALVLVATLVTLASIDFSSQRVDRSNVSIQTVERGRMEVTVGVSGELQSDQIEHLASQVSGRVAKLHVRPGARVEARDLLVELTNPQLVTAAEEAESAWEGAVRGLQAERAELHTSMLNQESLLVQARFTLEKAKLQRDAEAGVAEQKIISEIDFKRTLLDASQAEQLFKIEENRLREIRDNIAVQLAVAESRVTQMARALDRAKDQVASLEILAGIEGVVQTIDVEVGQQLQPGVPIGRVARQDTLYAELRVPAREAAELRIDQRVRVDTRNGVVQGKVVRVDPGVTSGAVIVDVELEGSLPPSARPQLQVEATIFIDEFPNTLYVGRPAYVGADSSVAVYKLDSSGRYAERVTIKVGKLSLHHVQVLEGLKEGDRIITSEIGAWQDRDRILLN